MPMSSVQRQQYLRFFSVRVVVEDEFGTAQMDFIRPDDGALSMLSQTAYSQFALGVFLSTKYADNNGTLDLSSVKAVHVFQLDRLGRVIFPDDEDLEVIEHSCDYACGEAGYCLVEG